MRTVRHQEGLAAAAVIVVIILAVLLLLLGRGAYEKFELGLDQRGVTDANMRRIADALVAYASLNQSLPCPARGDDASLAPDEIGRANPESATTSCGSPDGVVPWKTISLSTKDALDGWGRKISYRVFSGSNGFTGSNGVNMTNCNSSLGAPIDNSPLGSGSVCKPASPPVAPPNTPDQFLAARGNMLVIEDMGTTRIGNAFVLISHGESGYGAYLAEGATSRTTLPDNGGREFTNTQAGGSYWILARSAPDIAPGAAIHFDDQVAYMSAADLVTKAKLYARSWSNYPLSSQFSASAIAAVLPGFSAGSQDTGQTSLAMGGFLISATSSGTERNIGFREQDGVGGIGVIGGSSSSGDLNSAFGERLTFQLGEGSEFGKMDVALNAFQITDVSPLRRERAEITFWRAGEPVQTATVASWDEDSNPTRCLFRLVSGGMFDRMDVAPVSQTGGGGSSRFTVAAIVACTDPTTPCATEVPGAVACPIPPPSTASISATGIGTSSATLHGVVEDNGVSKGTGTGYRTTASPLAFGTRLIPLTTGSGTILAGNCVTISGDTYEVSTGIISSVDTLELAAPGLRQSISGGERPSVDVVHCETTVDFDYGPTCTYGSNATPTPDTINAGSGNTSVSASISGLTCNTSYHFRTRATGRGGTTTSDKTFRTAACPSPNSKPIAQSNTSTNVTATSATLNGVVSDNGAATTVTFEYGLTSCYGSSIAATPGTISAGAGSRSVSASIGASPDPPLACNTLYHFRVRGVNAAGTTTGNDTVFTTAACP